MDEFKSFWQAVKEGRALLKPVSEWKALTDGTRNDYAQKFAALGDQLPAQAAKCKKSYYTLRAAYLHNQTRAIRENLNTLDKWVKAQGGVESFRDRSKVFFEQAEALGLLKQFSNYQAVMSAAPFVGPRTGVDQPTHGKRAVGRLPHGWKTKLVGGVPKKSKYRAHVAAMALCGCRPSEFQNGILVTKLDDDTYKFELAGKKTGVRVKDGKTFTTGQSFRTITVSREDMLDKHGHINPEFIVLDMALKGKAYTELTANAIAIRDVVRRASKKAYPELKNKPSAYSFRHAFASELKAANGTDSVETAAALGHASTKTQGCYGYGKSGGRGGYTRKASAADAIRTPHLSRVESLKNAQSKKAKSTVSKVAMPSPATPKAPLPAPPRTYPKPTPFRIR